MRLCFGDCVWMRIVFLVIGFQFITPVGLAQDTAGCTSSAAARQIVGASLAAQGGEAKLRAFQAIQLELVASRNWVEQSERPEGPYIPDFEQITETHDFKNQRVRREIRTEIPSFPLDPFTSTWVADREVAASLRGEKWVPGSSSLIGEAADVLALSPERVLISALDSGSLHCEADQILGSVAHQVIAFTFQDSLVRVLINKNTHLPGLVESHGASARSGFWRFVGDISMRVRWTTWSVVKGGAHYPLQWNIERNGLNDQVICVRRLVVNPSLDPTILDIPNDVRLRFMKDPPNSDVELSTLGSPNQPPEVIVPGIITIPGAWNVSFIEQDDGVLILEAPVSSGFSAKVMAEAERNFPAKKIKAVITTSDAWPHLAGLREYVARGIPIYALDLNRTIINRILDEPRTVKPDTLSREPRVPAIHWISDKIVLGTGANRLEIYPLRGATTERQMMVYFPEHQLLYGSDAFQRQPADALWLPQTVSEVLDAVERHGLVVQKFFMMHMELSDWKTLQEDFQKAIAP